MTENLTPPRRPGEPLPGKPIVIGEYKPVSAASVRRPDVPEEYDILEDTAPLLPAYRPERLGRAS